MSCTFILIILPLIMILLRSGCYRVSVCLKWSILKPFMILSKVVRKFLEYASTGLLATLSICEGREFIERQARYKCPIENIKLKLTTKSQIYKCQPEPLLMLAHSWCYFFLPCFCKYLCSSNTCGGLSFISNLPK